jgi:hypothetical protein
VPRLPVDALAFAIQSSRPIDYGSIARACNTDGWLATLVNGISCSDCGQKRQRVPGGELSGYDRDAPVTLMVAFSIDNPGKSSLLRQLLMCSHISDARAESEAVSRS